MRSKVKVTKIEKQKLNESNRVIYDYLCFALTSSNAEFINFVENFKKRKQESRNEAQNRNHPRKEEPVRVRSTEK